jgi:hypothetical protein
MLPPVEPKAHLSSLVQFNENASCLLRIKKAALP